MGLRPFFPPASAALALAFALATGAAACHDVGLYPLQARPADAGSEPVDVGMPVDADGPIDDGATDLGGTVDAGTDAPTVPITCPDIPLVGFATLVSAGVDGGPSQVGTTGGGNLAPVKVTNYDAFVTAVSDTVPRVVEVVGLIAFPPVPDGGAPNKQQVKVSSNKTIVGPDASSGFIGGGLFIDGATNVIVRNLKISGAFQTDAITIQASTNVWIDHCDLSCDPTQPNLCDGLIDVTHASDFVTISWTYYHDHDASGLVGHSDNNETEDKNHLTVTYHHDLFFKVTSGPRLRFGQAHLFNVDFEHLTSYAVGSTCGAQAYIERCVFEDVKTPITTMVSTSPLGFVREGASESANVYLAPTLSTDNTINTQSATFSPTYLYSSALDPMVTTQAIVQACAGTGKIKTPLVIPPPN